MPKRMIVTLLLAVLACGCGSKPKTTDELITDLKSADEKDRINAIHLLSQRPSDAAQTVSAMIEVLKDKEGDVRRRAAISLGSFGDLAKDAVPALQAAQKDKDARVSKAAGTALSRIDPQQFPQK